MKKFTKIQQVYIFFLIIIFQSCLALKTDDVYSDVNKQEVNTPIEPTNTFDINYYDYDYMLLSSLPSRFYNPYIVFGFYGSIYSYPFVYGYGSYYNQYYGSNHYGSYYNNHYGYNYNYNTFWGHQYYNYGYGNYHFSTQQTIKTNKHNTYYGPRNVYSNNLPVHNPSNPNKIVNKPINRHYNISNNPINHTSVNRTPSSQHQQHSTITHQNKGGNSGRRH